MPDIAINTRFNGRDGGIASMLGRFGNKSRDFGNRANRAFGKANAAGRMFGNTMKNMVRNLLFIFGARAIVRFAGESIEAWNKQEAAIASVRATLISTNMTVGRTLEDLTQQAKNFQNNTFFGDESILQGVTAQLLTFKNIQGDAFDSTQQAVIDVTAKLKGLEATENDLRTISIALGKALNDPIANLGALSRSGIQFSDSQTEVIKSLAATNRLAEAQDLILQEIALTYGGTAEMIAQTTGGMERQFQNFTGDLQETIGKGLVPIKIVGMEVAKMFLSELTPAIENFGSYVQDNLPQIRQFFMDIGNTIKTVFTILGPPITAVFDAILKLGGVILDIATSVIKVFVGETATMDDGLDALAFTLNIVAGVIDWFAKAIKFLKPLIIPLVAGLGIWTIAQWALNVALTANPIGLIVVGVGLLIAGIVLLIEHWDEITTAIGKGVRDIWNWFSGLLDNPFFVALGVIFLPFITIPALIIKHWDKISKLFLDIWNNILAPFGLFIADVFGAAFTTVADVVIIAWQGVADFFQWIWDNVIGPIVGFIESATTTVGDFFNRTPEFVKLGRERELQEREQSETNEQAPNTQEAEAKTFSFLGRLDITGAPEGSTVEQEKTGFGALFDINLLGVNP